MTSPEDLNLLSWRNFFLLTCIALAVLFPVALRRFFSKQVETITEGAPPSPPSHGEGDLESGLGPTPLKGPGLVRLDDEAEGGGSGRVR